MWSSKTDYLIGKIVDYINLVFIILGVLPLKLIIDIMTVASWNNNVSYIFHVPDARSGTEPMINTNAWSSASAVRMTRGGQLGCDCRETVKRARDQLMCPAWPHTTDARDKCRPTMQIGSPSRDTDRDVSVSPPAAAAATPLCHTDNASIDRVPFHKVESC